MYNFNSKYFTEDGDWTKQAHSLYNETAKDVKNLNQKIEKYISKIVSPNGHYSIDKAYLDVAGDDGSINIMK